MKTRYNRVAIVTESLWKMAGANRVLEVFTEMYPEADIYALVGNSKNISKGIKKHNIEYSFLNKIPFIKKIYRYTYFLWPLAIESFDLSEYDLVISSSASVAHGCITAVNAKHVAYTHSPMRYAWDMKDQYFNKNHFGLWKRLVIPFFLTYLRAWDVVAAQRTDVLITNSNFVAKRCEKYWGRIPEAVINPPVDLYSGKIVKKRGNYLVCGAPLEPNKGGEFLLNCAKELGFNLKVIGNGSLLNKLKRKYSKCPNIEFLGWVDEETKWNLLSRAKGFVISGVEDFGIFPIEAMSCGTPVLAFKKGGALETVNEGVNGIFFEEHSLESFQKGYKTLVSKKWNSEEIIKSAVVYKKKKFINKFEKYFQS